MIEASCECGAVRIEIETPPKTVGECNCSICRRYGALWAYCAPAQVRVSGATTAYLRGDRQTEFHHCAVCRCLTHWVGADRSAKRMAVNARLMEPDVLKSAQIVPLDGASL